MEVGSGLVDYLKHKEYDLLILLGDYAYDMNDNNGKEGDDYFDQMEDILTKQPSIMVPGNHDFVDNFQFLNVRWQ